MAITNAGRVGIGTDTPASLLEISSAGPTAFTMKATDDKGVSIKMNTDGTQKAVIGYYAVDDALKIGHSESGVTTANDQLVIKEGRAGFGTPTPTQRLDVQGNIAHTGAMYSRGPNYTSR
jgi:hypothetical protein